VFNELELLNLCGPIPDDGRSKEPYEKRTHGIFHCGFCSGDLVAVANGSSRICSRPR
jgi:hypothetical protein